MFEIKLRSKIFENRLDEETVDWNILYYEKFEAAAHTVNTIQSRIRCM